MEGAGISVETIVMDGVVFTGDRARPSFRPGAVAIRQGEVACVGSVSEVLAAYTAEETIDAKGGIVHPGMMDTHLHLTSILFHGLPIDADGTSQNTVFLWVNTPISFHY